VRVSLQVLSTALFLILTMVKETYEVCTLVADLASIPRSDYKRVTSDTGVHYYEVDFSIRATMVDDILKFELFRRRKSYGEVTARFE
jgi:hypothetical protein